MLRGQAEILVIVGVVVVVSLAVFYAFQSNLIVPPGTGISAQQRTVKDAVNTMIRNNALKTITTLAAQGGYDTAPANSVTFLSKPVPYWFSAGASSKPDVLASMASSLQSAIEAAAPALEQSLDRVTFGAPKVSVQSFPRQLDITVVMPTTVSGVTKTETYAVSLPTRFGEALELANQFVQSYPQKRYLEIFTISSIFISPIKDDVQSVPVFIQPTCGEIITRTSLDVMPEMEELIKTTLGGTYMVGKSPKNNGATAPSPNYEIPQLGGKSFPDLDVSFHLPDDFALNFGSFQMTPDPVIAAFDIIPFFGGCVPGQVNIQYYVQYPAIVRIKDPDTSAIFQFAVQVTVKNNKPAPVSDQSSSATELQTALCANPSCPMDLLVSADSQPLDDAQIVYLGCPIGRTDSSGQLQTAVPCGAGSLQVRKAGYAPSITSRNNQDVQELSVSLQKIPRFSLHLHEVDAQLFAGAYTIPDTGSYLINKQVYLTFTSLDTGAVYSLLSTTSALTVSSVPPGDYAVTASLTSIPIRGVPSALTVYGAAAFTVALPSSLDGQTLHLYIPKYAPLASQEQSEQVQTAALLGDLITQCGMALVSTVPAQGCIKQSSEITGGFI